MVVRAGGVPSVPRRPTPILLTAAGGEGGVERREVGRRSRSQRARGDGARHSAGGRAGALLTLMPSQRDTARRGRKALSVRMDRKAGMSSAPAQMAARFIRDTYKTEGY